jgi:hypothetical protein
MAGVSLRGFIGRIPCPHCGSTDCCGYDGIDLICSKTDRKFTDSGLMEAARAAKLPEYEEVVLGNGWIGRVITKKRGKSYPAGSVHLHSVMGHRGVAPTRDAAIRFALANKNPWAHWDEWSPEAPH